MFYFSNKKDEEKKNQIRSDQIKQTHDLFLFHFENTDAFNYLAIEISNTITTNKIK